MKSLNRKIYIIPLLLFLALSLMPLAQATIGDSCDGGIEGGGGRCISYSEIVDNITWCSDTQDLGTIGVQIQFPNSGAQCAAIAGSGGISLLNTDTQDECNGELGLIGPAGGVACFSEYEAAFAWNAKSNGGQPPQGIIDLLSGQTEPDEGDDIDVEDTDSVPGETTDPDPETPGINEDYTPPAQAQSTSTATSIPLGLAERVSTFYTYAIGLGALVALGVIIYGGLAYSASAGNPGRIEEAKKWIQHAIFGLILLFSSFIILNFINPDLTTLDELLIEQNPEVLESEISAFETVISCNEDPELINLSSVQPTALYGRSTEGMTCPIPSVVPGFQEDWNFPRLKEKPEFHHHAGTDLYPLYNPTSVEVVALEAGRVLGTNCDRPGIEMKMGGLYILFEGARSRNIYYYAHLSSCSVRRGQSLSEGEPVGFVGDTGAAQGGPPHLHVSVAKPGADKCHPEEEYLINSYHLIKLLCERNPNAAGWPTYGDGCRQDCHSGPWGDRSYCILFQHCGGQGTSPGAGASPTEQQCVDRCLKRHGSELSADYEVCVINCF